MQKKCRLSGKKPNATIEVTTTEVITKTPVNSTTSKEASITTTPVTVIKTTTEGKVIMLLINTVFIIYFENINQSTIIIRNIN